jgi:methylenetetrahydrofolate dehydrogenase (NADP+)/methenyltetrahydrofolate cyclohydrolase
MILIDGRKAREYYLPLLVERIKSLPTQPTLLIVQVGSRADSDAFIKGKKSFALKIGAKEIHKKFGENVTQAEVIDFIKAHNDDKNINGIIIQLPLPAHLNSDEIIQNINPLKDVDGLTHNTKFMPATARGISELLDFYKIKLANKNVVVMGRSKLVGGPIASMCRVRGAAVTVLHSKSEKIQDLTKKAEILIVSIGKAKLIDKKYISNGQTVIDVGINRIGDAGNSRLVGDVDFNSVKDIVEMITPVPGGVGQMTVLALFENLVDAC